jgi:ssDNA-binding Zn-finger/Zn-ribbon topoisomerase 1
MDFNYFILYLERKEAELAGRKDETVFCSCGREMLRRKGKWGEFWGCSGYPLCTNTKR